MIDRELLEILACTEDRSAVTLADAPLVERLNEGIRRKAIKNRGGQVDSPKIRPRHSASSRA